MADQAKQAISIEAIISAADLQRVAQAWNAQAVGTGANSKYVNRAYDYNPYHKRFEVEYTLSRWIPAIQADFAARAEWCIHEQLDRKSVV